MSGDVRLTEADREALAAAMCVQSRHQFYGHDHNHDGACVVLQKPPYAAVERILSARLAAERERIAEAIEGVAVDVTFRSESWSEGFWDGIENAARIARTTPEEER